MGNTHLRMNTRRDLREYADNHEHNSLDDAVVALLAEHKLLQVTQRKCELLEKLFEPYELDEGDDA